MAHHLLIPAAGSGQRFGAGVPKQYVELGGLPLIEKTLQRLAGMRHFDSISVGLAAGDSGWQSSLTWRRVAGGSSRAQTVLALLESLEPMADDDDWVWVQDAVRPFLSGDVLARIEATLETGAHCVLPGLPASDTLKRVTVDQQVADTLERASIWCAQTPQVCRYRKLLTAMRAALQSGREITDEAMAMELAGHRVQLVAGSEDNIKITRPGDLRLAELIESQR